MSEKRARYKRKSGDGKGILRTINGSILDVRSCAAFLGGSPKSIYARVARREIPYRMLGGRVVFLRSELEKFVENLPGLKLSDLNNNERGF